MADWRIEKLEPEATYVLRSLVLRPGKPMETTRWEGDFLETTFHFGAFLPDKNEPLVICSLFLRAPESGPSLDPEFCTEGFQLRGMASHPSVRGQGGGAALMDEVLRQFEGKPIWCNAREKAELFYRRLGFIRVGDVFDVAGIGPHFRLIYRSR